MRYSDLLETILDEEFPFAVGDAPTNIIDLRAKDWNKRASSDRKVFGFNLSATYVVLAKDGKVIFYVYGSTGNSIEWRKVLELCEANIDRTIQLSTRQIQVYRNGYIIDDHPSDNPVEWAGKRTRYSADVRTVARALLDRGIATERTPLWLGRESSPVSIGSVGKLLASPELPNRITLYHGTSSMRLPEILKNGLCPLAQEDRVWNKGGLEKERPAHRDTSVYLTASIDQAQYYAGKAVRIDRVRMGPDARRKASSAVFNARSTLVTAESRLKYLRSITPEQEAALDAHSAKYSYGRYTEVRFEIPQLERQIEHARELIAKFENLANTYHSGPVRPVILQITLRKSELGKLLADDDFLARNKDASPEDWLRSLQEFSQIAYQGSIPPERIKVIKGE